MKTYRFIFEVDVPNSIIIIRYSGRLEGADLRESLLDNLRGFENAWRYDCIFDVRGYPDVFSDEDNREVGDLWLEMTKGRDVGRRTAIVGTDPALATRMAAFQSSFPYRKYAYFDDFEVGMAWIRGLADPDAAPDADDAQFI